MDAMEYAVLGALLVVATLAGGAVFTLLVAADEAQFGVAFALLDLLVAAAIVGGARGDRWRENPYW